ncbi:MAG TPA: hypothetical protein VER96_41710 [Polyangiaceae bacterium]|nr:hypothetical protein [Polyangiaceae bacterium]
MARHSFAVLVVPLLFVACGDSKGAPAGAGGASPVGVIGGAAGESAKSGGASSASGGASAGSGVAVAGSSGGNGGNRSVASGGYGNAGGQAQLLASGAGGTAGLSVAGTASGGETTAGGSMASGIPGNWVPVTGVDSTKVPGPNFETVQYMFKGVPCSGSNCHFGGRNHLTVDKTPDALYTYMKNFKTLECGKLIDTTNPSESALVKYLRGPCGSLGRMPLDKCTDDGDELCVPNYYIDFIEQWIAAGAPR